jgi:histone deacetylase 1/2
MDNANSREYLDKIRAQVIENLRRTTFAPSVQMTDVPRDSMAINDEDEAELDDMDEDQNPDKRNTQHRFNKYVEKPGELSDSEDEEMNEANGVRKQPGSRKRRNRLDYRNLNEWNGDSAVTSGAATPQAASSVPDNDGDDDMNIEDAEPVEKIEHGTVSTADGANRDVAASEALSPKAAEDEEDVAMEDAEAEVAQAIPDASTAAPPSSATVVQQGVTPPDSPPNLPGIITPASSPEAGPEAGPEAEPSASADPAIKNEMAAEDAAVTAQAEGLAEREEQNTDAEAAAEQASKSS